MNPKIGEPDGAVSGSQVTADARLRVKVEPQPLATDLKVGVDQAGPCRHVRLQTLSVEPGQVVLGQYIDRSYQANITAVISQT